MEIKVSEATRRELNYLVAKCEGLNEEDFVEVDNLYGPVWRGPEYSTDWAQGGPIIEREGIALLPPGVAEMPGFEGMGETLLIAAMRCFVASKLGDEVDVPDELKENES